MKLIVSTFLYLPRTSILLTSCSLIYFFAKLTREAICFLTLVLELCSSIVSFCCFSLDFMMVKDLSSLDFRFCFRQENLVVLTFLSSLETLVFLGKYIEFIIMRVDDFNLRRSSSESLPRKRMNSLDLIFPSSEANVVTSSETDVLIKDLNSLDFIFPSLEVIAVTSSETDVMIKDLNSLDFVFAEDLSSLDLICPSSEA